MPLSHQIIYDLVPPQSTVLDLGCGDGSLLQLLQRKDCPGQGLELNPQMVQSCINKGIPVIQQDIDEGFADYQDQSFDYVLLNRTLQVTHKPLLVLQEALRVGHWVIVSFPNFAYYLSRAQLFWQGSMPKSKVLPYEWYNTPNIHLVSIRDFLRFCQDNRFRIHQQIFYNERHRLLRFWPNLLSPFALFVLSK